MVLPNRHKRIASAKARARKGLPPSSRAPRSTLGQSSTAAPEGPEEDVEDVDSGHSVSSEADEGGADEGDAAIAESDEEDFEAAAFERDQIAAFVGKQAQKAASEPPDTAPDPADVDTHARGLLAAASTQRPPKLPPASRPAQDAGSAPLGREIERDTAAKELRRRWRAGVPAKPNHASSPGPLIAAPGTSSAAEDIDTFLHELS